MKYKRRWLAIFLAPESLGPNNFRNLLNGLNIHQLMISQLEDNKTKDRR